MKLKQGLPTVAVDDILIHPRERDLIVGTHGRSVYVLDDIGPLEQSTGEVLGQAVTCSSRARRAPSSASRTAASGGTASSPPRTRRSGRRSTTG